MANNYKHTRTVSDTIKVKGLVHCSEGGTYITYENEKEEYTLNVLDIFNQFAGEIVNINISTKDEIDLEE